MYKIALRMLVSPACRRRQATHTEGHEKACARASAPPPAPSSATCFVSIQWVGNGRGARTPSPVRVMTLILQVLRCAADLLQGPGSRDLDARAVVGRPVWARVFSRGSPAHEGAEY